MKKLIYSFLMLTLFGGSTVSAQFWGGFFQGMANAMQQQRYYQQQQQYYQRQRQNQNNQRQSNSCSSEPIDEKKYVENDGFVWIRLRQWSTAEKIYKLGAKDENGQIIIPLSRGYDRIYYMDEEGYGGYFQVEKGGKEGICDRYGKVLYTPTSNTSYIFIDGVFKKKTFDGEWVKTQAYLDSEGHGHVKSSGSSSTYGWGNSYNFQPSYGYSAPAAPDFNNNVNSYSSGNSSHHSTSSGYNHGGQSDCHVCRGSGRCHTCNGSGYVTNFGKRSECPNCLIEYGRRTGKCSVCGGDGKVFR